MIKRSPEPNDPPNGAEQSVDATTILDNVVQLDEMLDEGSRRALGGVQYLELSKHLKIKKTGT